MSGMSPRNGTLRCTYSLFSVMSPPSTIVSPSAAATVACAVVVSTRGERTTVAPSSEAEIGMPSFTEPTADFSASISITTLPSGLTRGVTPRIKPTSSSCTELLVPNWFVVEPIIRGTRSPTWM